MSRFLLLIYVSTCLLGACLSQSRGYTASWDSGVNSLTWREAQDWCQRRGQRWEMNVDCNNLHWTYSSGLWVLTLVRRLGASLTFLPRQADPTSGPQASRLAPPAPDQGRPWAGPMGPPQGPAEAAIPGKCSFWSECWTNHDLQILSQVSEWCPRPPAWRRGQGGVHRGPQHQVLQRRGEAPRHRLRPQEARGVRVSD